MAHEGLGPGSSAAVAGEIVKHIVALSGGKDSTAMALRLRELEPDTDFTYVCTPTGAELPEMFEHWKRLGALLGKPLTPIMHPDGLDGLIVKQKALPNWRMRWCTRKLKIEPYAYWLAQNVPAISYVGLRADEPDREGGDYSEVSGVEMRFPMRDWGWELADVLDYLKQRGVTIPARTDCDRCFFQKLDEWRDLWAYHPDRYQAAADQEAMVGATFRSPGRDSWPASLADLAKEFERGRKLHGVQANVLDKQTAMWEGALEEAKCRVCRL